MTIFLLLIGGAALTSYQLAQVNQASERAKNNWDLLSRVLGFMDFLSENRRLTVPDVLDRIVEELDTGLAGQPLREADARQQIGKAYRMIPGCEDKAVQQSRLAWEIHKNELGPDDLDTLESGDEYGETLKSARRWLEARDVFRSILAGRRRVLDQAHPQTLRTQALLAYMLAASDRKDEALENAHEARRLMPPGADAHDPVILEARLNLSYALHNAKARDEATLLARQLRQDCFALPSDHWLRTESAAICGQFVGLQGELDEAIPMVTEAWDDRCERLGETHPLTLQLEDALGYFIHQRGDPRGALPLLRHARNSYPPGLRLRRSYVTWRLAKVEEELGDPEEAIRLLEDDHGFLAAELGPQHEHAIRYERDLALMYQRNGREVDGKRVREEVLWACDARDAELGRVDRLTIQTLNQFVYRLRDGDRDSLEEAEELARRGCEDALGVLPATDLLVPFLHTNYAIILHRLERSPKACDYFKRALALHLDDTSDDKPWFERIALEDHFRALRASGRDDAARELAQRVIAEAEPGSPPHTTAQSLLAELGGK